MSNAIIEVLSKSGVRRERLSSLRMMSQKSAVRDLVKVTHQQLVANQIDRDASSYWPKRQHRFDAFFYVPKINGVISITSVGLPDAQDTSGLFLDIDYRNDKGETKELVGIITAKVPEVVGEKEALGLSSYLPRQLLKIAEIVRTANPISQKTYQSYFEEPRVLAGVRQEAETTADTPKEIEEADRPPPSGIDGWTLRRAKEGNEDGHLVR